MYSVYYKNSNCQHLFTPPFGDLGNSIIVIIIILTVVDVPWTSKSRQSSWRWKFSQFSRRRNPVNLVDVVSRQFFRRQNPVNLVDNNPIDLQDVKNLVRLPDVKILSVFLLSAWQILTQRRPSKKWRLQFMPSPTHFGSLYSRQQVPWTK